MHGKDMLLQLVGLDEDCTHRHDSQRPASDPPLLPGRDPPGMGRVGQGLLLGTLVPIRGL